MGHSERWKSFVLGVVVANIDVLMGIVVLHPAARAICVALYMAVL